MNKRMKKKQSTRPRGLSQEEKLVLELYRKCDNVHFFKYDETNALDCFDFTDLVEVTSEVNLSESYVWTEATKGKIEASAFLK
ncbi:hypothetical protein [Trichococcus collinsii]|uniref:Uncharacterized protein n=1 Tax=Trichococcus collinsii TaxID=157076 RepID=A0AB37ZXG9_9LACT|nr:hypothetical protein [Trichococcus collinsii]CZR02791.1 Hypothetical protein Tcol_2080 [Trichococcus collinsii]SDZ96744.1 hypothetical protein SAMN04488525_101744 [Trichococcus collinsii]